MTVPSMPRRRRSMWSIIRRRAYLVVLSVACSPLVAVFAIATEAMDMWHEFVTIWREIPYF